MENKNLPTLTQELFADLKKLISLEFQLLKTGAKISIQRSKFLLICFSIAVIFFIVACFLSAIAFTQAMSSFFGLPDWLCAILASLLFLALSCLLFFRTKKLLNNAK